MTDPIRIGILYSTTGPYGAFGRDCTDGAVLAAEALNEEALKGRGLPVELVLADPAGEAGRYVSLARALLREKGCRHIVGTALSAARKDVTPLVEKHDALLWYLCPYEGFEANENIIYTGACPNQHLLPLFEHLIPRHGGRVFLLGANYVWGWEMNRLARELLDAAGGEVAGERFLPIEETEIGRLIAEIRAARPSFILNNLIGPSSYAFLAAMRALGREEPAFRPEACPVVSCDLTECELPEIPDGAGVGQLAAACWFDSLDLPESRAFRAQAAARFGAGRRFSSFFSGAYAAVRLCAEAIRAASTDEPAAVRRAVCGPVHPTVQGPIRIDPRTNHAALPFHLGRINAEGGFDVIASRPPVAADPYLTGVRSGSRIAAPTHLRVVS
ncbi:transporter substrate-binding protein [Ancylobacter sp. 6x-1]|uniref:Transporter substrate-binding protein n=1 Tax=Ancylobacter crimeensis TaxID=2579147 RepID=A0ABT0DDC2_9HYPH|nr:transporter substrate-binding protein [Ancylobacter crimeensis]MCK0197963.1 transporter substrate-binding protein [Ancylobacter crimeensis]